MNRNMEILITVICGVLVLSVFLFIVTVTKDSFYKDYLGKYHLKTYTSPYLESLSDNLTKECYNTSKYRKDSCVFNEIGYFVYTNITYNGNYTDFPGPMKVLNRGEGRCVGKAVLFNSLIESQGYNTSFVFQETENPDSEHVCSLVNLHGKQRFWNCGSGKIMDIVS